MSPNNNGFAIHDAWLQKEQVDLRINFVFKQTGQASLRVSAANHAAIVGDVNAARFLCRSNKYATLALPVR